MAQTSKLILALAGLLVAASPQTVWACTDAPNGTVYDVLGVGDPWRTAEEDELRLPRNVAFVFWSRRAHPQLTAADTTVELELLGAEPEEGFGLLTPSTPLEPGVMYTYNFTEKLTVEDYVDEVAPQPGRVVTANFTATESKGTCGFDSCGDRATITMQIEPGVDDHTTRRALTYAVFIGETAEEARTTTRVERYTLLESGDQTWIPASFEWSESDLYFAVSTLDHAGNESPRTEPILIHSAPSGCSVAYGADVSSAVWVFAALVWHAKRRRKSATVRVA
jgi:hypothetical protein